MSTERPILFSGPMVRALLAGKKTQTRRLYRPRYPSPYEIVDETPAGEAWPFQSDEYGDYHFRASPYGGVGDRLWVRETWCDGDRWHGCSCDPPCTIRYAANDYTRTFTGPGRAEWYEPDTRTWSQPKKWRPSIFMPRWASRISLDVSGIRFQRLQDINEEDAKAEGLKALSKDGGRTIKYGVPDRDGWPGTDDDGWPWHEWETDPRKAYAKLWDQINGARAPWASNPWVWAVSFPDNGGPLKHPRTG